jgi:hypothetical protein
MTIIAGQSIAIYFPEGQIHLLFDRKTSELRLTPRPTTTPKGTIMPSS